MFTASCRNRSVSTHLHSCYEQPAPQSDCSTQDQHSMRSHDWRVAPYTMDATAYHLVYHRPSQCQRTPTLKLRVFFGHFTGGDWTGVRTLCVTMKGNRSCFPNFLHHREVRYGESTRVDGICIGKSARILALNRHGLYWAPEKVPPGRTCRAASGGRIRAAKVDKTDAKSSLSG